MTARTPAEGERLAAEDEVACSAPIRVNLFERGRDLAVKMLREGAGNAPFAEVALEARERDDPRKPQRRWVLAYLRQLQRDPTLLDGFSAILSDFLASGTGGTPDHYERVTLAMLTELPDGRG
jgi:hypothetical protein